MAQRSPEVSGEVAGGNALRAVYPGCSSARLYTAAELAATGLGFAITRRDDAATTLSFRTVGPTPRWPRIEMTAAVAPQGSGARVVVGGRHMAGYRPQMADWHQANAIGLMFIDRLTSVLPGVAEPATEAPPAPSVVDQLESLADLRERGALTEEEFAAEKKKLLS
jgi:hypothetical protein